MGHETGVGVNQSGKSGGDITGNAGADADATGGGGSGRGGFRGGGGRGGRGGGRGRGRGGTPNSSRAAHKGSIQEYSGTKVTFGDDSD